MRTLLGDASMTGLGATLECGANEVKGLPQRLTASSRRCDGTCDGAWPKEQVKLFREWDAEGTPTTPRCRNDMIDPNR
jgi:hypothetical protein